LSRSFVAALIGVAITIFSWYGPWSWPAWPALAMISLSHFDLNELPYAARAALMVFLILINVCSWAVFSWVIMRVLLYRPRHDRLVR
jgi:hypothetical protein